MSMNYQPLLALLKLELVGRFLKFADLGGAREGGFLGAEVILAQMENGTNFKKVALIAQGKAPVRDGSFAG